MHVAIVGGGQLARMLAQAGSNIGMTFSFLAGSNEDVAPVSGLGYIVRMNEHYKQLEASSNSDVALDLFNELGKPDCITIEKEDVPLRLLEQLDSLTRVLPGPGSIRPLINKADEKTYLGTLDIPTVDFVCAASPESVISGVEKLGYPVIIKTAQSGYDGKNQWHIQNPDELQEFFGHYDRQVVVIEKKVNLSTELSLIGVRGLSGEIRFYPLTENKCSKGILVSSQTTVNQSLLQHEAMARQFMNDILVHLDYVGVLAVEFFVVDGRLLVNELAPRVHNTGHWTLDAGICSQFENHLRAIIGLQLGPTEPSLHCGMVNFIGRRKSELNSLYPDHPGWTYHDYGKSFAPGRKLGHFNLYSVDRQYLLEQMRQLEQSLYRDERSGDGHRH